MSGRALVIDANILVRAVLGTRVREIIETYAGQATFFVPDSAYGEAEEHVPALVIRRGGDPEKAVRFLRSLRGLVDLIGSEVYADFESMARERLGDRDRAHCCPVSRYSTSVRAQASMPCCMITS